MSITFPAATARAPRRSDAPAPAVSLSEVTRDFGGGGGRIRALDGVSLDVAPASFTAIMGPSGSGKSTLLQLAAGLDRPTQGAVRLAGADLGGLGERALSRLRRDHVGFVFQSFNLLAALTAAQNVALPSRLARRRLSRAAVRAALEDVGLGDRAGHRPSELSGGQQQRVAIARALAGDPRIVFADEPTGALDRRAGHEVLALLRRAVDERRAALVMVTHDPVAAAWADRVVFLADGRLAGELTHPTAERVAERLTALGD